MTHSDTPAYGLWGLAFVNAAIFIFFAFSFFKPETKRDWRGRVRQCGVELGVASGLHFQAALGVICSGCASSIIGVARAAMPSICM
jgi:hypothetical protein